MISRKPKSGWSKLNSLAQRYAKSVEELLPVHWKQLFTQLKLKDFRLGLLINFGEHLKNGIRRIANKL
jgi:hypothetical protein